MVIKFIPRNLQTYSDLYSGDINFYWKLVEASFRSRRKTLKNNLKSLCSKEEIEALDKHLISLRDSDLNQDYSFDLSNRGEELSEKDFIYLYNTLVSFRN